MKKVNGFLSPLSLSLGPIPTRSPSGFAQTAQERTICVLHHRNTAYCPKGPHLLAERSSGVNFLLRRCAFSSNSSLVYSAIIAFRDGYLGQGLCKTYSASFYIVCSSSEGK